MHVPVLCHVRFTPVCMPDMVQLEKLFEHESRRLSFANVIELICQILRNVIAIEECNIFLQSTSSYRRWVIVK